VNYIKKQAIKAVISRQIMLIQVLEKVMAGKMLGVTITIKEDFRLDAFLKQKKKYFGWRGAE